MRKVGNCEATASLSRKCDGWPHESYGVVLRIARPCICAERTLISTIISGNKRSEKEETPYDAVSMRRAPARKNKMWASMADSGFLIKASEDQRDEAMLIWKTSSSVDPCSYPLTYLRVQQWRSMHQTTINQDSWVRWEEIREKRHGCLEQLKLIGKSIRTHDAKSVIKEAIAVKGGKKYDW